MSCNSLSPCTLCKSQPSITSCEGCKHKFCLLCVTQHRKELSLELDDLFNRRNELVETMNNRLPTNNTDPCSCFNAINQWQNGMHAKIDRIAATARDNVRQMLAESSQRVRTELDHLSIELQQRQKSGGYVEDDLNRLKEQLNRLNALVLDFDKQIDVNTDASKTIAWDSLIFVAPKRESPPSPPPPYTPPNPALHNSNGQGFFPPASMYYSNLNSKTSTPPPVHDSRAYYDTRTSMPHSSDVYRPYEPNTPGNNSNYQQSRPTQRYSAQRTFTCIGCKTVNNINPSGSSVCRVCRCPAKF